LFIRVYLWFGLSFPISSFGRMPGAARIRDSLFSQFFDYTRFLSCSGTAIVLFDAVSKQTIVVFARANVFSALL